MADAPVKERQEYISPLISALPLQLYYFTFFIARFSSSSCVSLMCKIAQLLKLFRSIYILDTERCGFINKKWTMWKCNSIKGMYEKSDCLWFKSRHSITRGVFWFIDSDSSNPPWYLTMLHIRQISITRIGCNRTLTIVRITRQESHRELMISLVLCTIPCTQSGGGQIIFLLTL